MRRLSASPMAPRSAPSATVLANRISSTQPHSKGARIVPADGAGEAAARGAPDPAAHLLHHGHQRPAEQRQPAQRVAEGGAGLRVGADRHRVVVGRAADQPRSEHAEEAGPGRPDRRSCALPPRGRAGRSVLRRPPRLPASTEAHPDRPGRGSPRRGARPRPRPLSPPAALPRRTTRWWRAARCRAACAASSRAPPRRARCPGGAGADRPPAGGGSPRRSGNSVRAMTRRTRSATVSSTGLPRLIGPGCRPAWAISRSSPSIMSET